MTIAADTIGCRPAVSGGAGRGGAASEGWQWCAEVAERVGGREITRRITRGTLINYYCAPREIPCRGMISPLSFPRINSPRSSSTD